MDKPFPCTRCGSCCKRAGLIESWVVMGWANEGGPCKFLTSDNLCAIYETRPEICQVRLAHKAMRSEQTWDDYVAESVAACNAMMDQDGVEAGYRIEG